MLDRYSLVVDPYTVAAIDVDQLRRAPRSIRTSAIPAASSSATTPPAS
jgi:hypothetical protein